MTAPDSMRGATRAPDAHAAGHATRPPFAWKLRVYYEDTDAAGVVYYANYLKFMERARTEWLRELGFENDGLARDFEVVFVVARVEIDYLSPARLNDELGTTVELRSVGRSLIEIAQTVRRGTALLAQANVRLVCVNTHSFRPVRIPQAINEKFAMRTA